MLWTHCGRDKMTAIFQTTFSNAYSRMKLYQSRLKFHWSLFSRVQSTIFQHWFRWWLGAGQATSHYLNQCWYDLLTHICVPGPQWVNKEGPRAHGMIPVHDWLNMPIKYHFQVVTTDLNCVVINFLKWFRSLIFAEQTPFSKMADEVTQDVSGHKSFMILFPSLSLDFHVSDMSQITGTSIFLCHS